MLELKQGVNITGIRPEMVLAAVAVRDVFDSYNFECVVTSALEGTHSFGSLHYAGCALDFRTKRAGVTQTQAEAMGEKIRHSLGVQFDVIVHETHIHVEFQPKHGPKQ